MIIFFKKKMPSTWRFVTDKWQVSNQTEDESLGVMFLLLTNAQSKTLTISDNKDIVASEIGSYKEIHGLPHYFKLCWNHWLFFFLPIASPKKVSIGDNVLNFEQNIFSDCYELSSVKNGKKLSQLDLRLLNNINICWYQHLIEVNISNSVTSIGSRSFIIVHI